MYVAKHARVYAICLHAYGFIAINNVARSTGNWPLNKYACHIAYVGPTELLLYSPYRLYISVIKEQKKPLQLTLAMLLPNMCQQVLLKMTHICHI